MVTKNKTPAEVEAVTITMSRETAQAVKQACEEYLRFRITPDTAAEIKAWKEWCAVCQQHCRSGHI